MGILTALAVGTAAVTVDSAEKQRKAASQSRTAQMKIQSEQRAANAGEAASERRRQIREERVRRARVLQSAENTGMAESSGELGALGAISTNLSSNIGTNLGKLQTAENISIFSQDVADANYAMQKAQLNAELSKSIFQMASSFGS